MELGVILTNPSHLFNSLCLFVSVAKAAWWRAKHSFEIVYWYFCHSILIFYDMQLHTLLHEYLIRTWTKPHAPMSQDRENTILYVCFLI